MIRNKSCDVDRASDGEQLALDVSLLTYMSDPETGPAHQEESTSNSSARPAVAHLPENVVRQIALHALQSGGRQISLLSLLALCGVCQHWRSAASYLEPGSHLQYDGTRGNPAAGVTTLEQRFRSLPQTERTAVLRAAARLFRGMHPLVCVYATEMQLMLSAFSAGAQSRSF
jgi:hypothetical protein